MKAASRLLAAVRAGEKYLTPNAPTGLTGLYTHPAPRATLVYLYNSTLDKLKTFPESSVYRQATENLTKHRLSIVDKLKPEGLEAWEGRMQEQISKLSPEDRERLSDPTLMRSSIVHEDSSGVEWDGAPVTPPFQEGTRTAAERLAQLAAVAKAQGSPMPTVELEAEPSLTAEQISALEAQIGAGLIEEVIQVAHNEHDLVDKMKEAQVWDELAEKAPEGQWTYFERQGTHTATQKP